MNVTEHNTFLTWFWLKASIADETVHTSDEFLQQKMENIRQNKNKATRRYLHSF